MRLPDRHDQEPGIGGPARDIGDVAGGLARKKAISSVSRIGAQPVRQCHRRRVGAGADKKPRSERRPIARAEASGQARERVVSP